MFTETHRKVILNLIFFPVIPLFNSYGDRAPKSVAGRIFGIIWTLIGLVIIGILVGAIASSLTSVTVQKDITLYGTKASSKQQNVRHVM